MSTQGEGEADVEVEADARKARKAAFDDEIQLSVE